MRCDAGTERSAGEMGGADGKDVIAKAWHRPVVPSGRTSAPPLTERDLAYRRALGLSETGPLPAAIGAQSSAGASRGGRGASQRGKGRYS